MTLTQLVRMINTSRSPLVMLSSSTLNWRSSTFLMSHRGSNRVNVSHQVVIIHVVNVT